MSKLRKKKTFIVDCPTCRSKVQATEKGQVEYKGIHVFNDYDAEPYGLRIAIGTCAGCEKPLVGESRQIAFESYDSHSDKWSDFKRVYPNPLRALSLRVPKGVRHAFSDINSLKGEMRQRE